MKEKLKTKKRIIYILINGIFIFLIAISVIYIIDFFSLKKEAMEESNLLNTIKINENEIIQTETRDTKAISEGAERIMKIKKLQKENPDIIGWIEIENTNINYTI